MFRFFTNLPDEIITKEIFSRFSRTDLAKVGTVDRRFNELSKIKPRKIVYSVGDTDLILQEEKDWKKSFSPFYLYIMKEEKWISDSIILIFNKSFEMISNAMKGDTLSLIRELKSHGGTSSKFHKNALLLEEAFDKAKTNNVKIKPKF